jgi:hypothetical protein
MDHLTARGFQRIGRSLKRAGSRLRRRAAPCPKPMSGGFDGSLDRRLVSLDDASSLRLAIDGTYEFPLWSGNCRAIDDRRRHPGMLARHPDLGEKLGK